MNRSHFKTRVRLHGGLFHNRLVELKDLHGEYLDIPSTETEIIDFGRTKLITDSKGLIHRYVFAGFAVRSSDGYQVYSFLKTISKEDV